MIAKSDSFQLSGREEVFPWSHFPPNSGGIVHFWERVSHVQSDRGHFSHIELYSVSPSRNLCQADRGASLLFMSFDKIGDASAPKMKGELKGVEFRPPLLRLAEKNIDRRFHSI